MSVRSDMGNKQTIFTAQQLDAYQVSVTLIDQRLSLTVFIKDSFKCIVVFGQKISHVVHPSGVELNVNLDVC